MRPHPRVLSRKAQPCGCAVVWAERKGKRRKTTTRCPKHSGMSAI